MKSDLTTQQLEEIDWHISRSLVLKAVQIYREATGCEIADAKEAIGARFRERFPERWASYRDVSKDEET